MAQMELKNFNKRQRSREEIYAQNGFVTRKVAEPFYLKGK